MRSCPGRSAARLPSRGVALACGDLVARATDTPFGSSCGSRRVENAGGRLRVSPSWQGRLRRSGQRRADLVEDDDTGAMGTLQQGVEETPVGAASPARSPARVRFVLQQMSDLAGAVLGLIGTQTPSRLSRELVQHAVGTVLQERRHAIASPYPAAR